MQDHIHVLLLEDDGVLASKLARVLTQESLKFTVAYSGEEALAKIRLVSPDILILDIELLGIDELEVLSHVRANGQTLPVMMLSGLDDIESRTKSFSLGADAILSKPVAISDFRLQVRALVRRVRNARSVKLVYGPLILDKEAGRAFLNGTPLVLTRREWSLLEILLTNAGRILSKEDVGRKLAGVDDVVSPTAVEVHMSRLRSKLEPGGIRIQWVRGLGYMLLKRDLKSAAVGLIRNG